MKRQLYILAGIIPAHYRNDQLYMYMCIAVFIIISIVFNGRVISITAVAWTLTACVLIYIESVVNIKIHFCYNSFL